IAVKALQGEDIPAFVEVPLPIIDDSNVDEYLARAGDFPADGYIFSPWDEALFADIIAGSK
ncbi:MAG: ABC transporter substrate-binding protein, partial [Thermoleophilia bacterium]|nr:ABC transporter substrate-binding protein [Thermoleophilia bacterium]